MDLRSFPQFCLLFKQTSLKYKRFIQFCQTLKLLNVSADIKLRLIILEYHMTTQLVLTYLQS